MKYIYIVFIVFFLSAPAFSAVQENYYNVSALKSNSLGDKNFRVTSIQKCYALLSQEEVREIRGRYIKPYRECQKRLREKEEKENVLKAGELRAVENQASRSFYRVQRVLKKEPPSQEVKVQKKLTFHLNK